MFKGETEEELQWEFAWIREKNGFGINQSEWGIFSDDESQTSKKII